MSSLREYRKKIKSVKSTQQITKALKMVAAARLRKAQSRILSARPFAIKMQALMADLSGRVGAGSAIASSPPPHPLLQNFCSGKSAILLVTADKGLCGSFNTNLIKKASEYLTENQRKEVRVFVVGRKGKDYFSRIGYPVQGEYINIFNHLSYAHAEIIGKDLMDVFLKERLSEVVLIYNEFKSVIQQKLTAERLLPVAKPAKVSAPQAIEFLFEPGRAELLNSLLPRYVKSQIFRVLLESSAAELGARMTAMDSATKNASELMEHLTLKLNRTRQAMITREIAELVGGAEALK